MNAMLRALAPAWVAAAGILLVGLLDGPDALLYTLLTMGLISCALAGVVVWVVMRRMREEERRTQFPDM